MRYIKAAVPAMSFYVDAHSVILFSKCHWALPTAPSTTSVVFR